MCGLAFFWVSSRSVKNASQGGGEQAHGSPSTVSSSRSSGQTEQFGDGREVPVGRLSASTWPRKVDSSGSRACTSTPAAVPADQDRAGQTVTKIVDPWPAPPGRGRRPACWVSRWNVDRTLESVSVVPAGLRKKLPLLRLAGTAGPGTARSGAALPRCSDAAGPPETCRTSTRSRGPGPCSRQTSSRSRRIASPHPKPGHRQQPDQGLVGAACSGKRRRPAAAIIAPTSASV